MRRFPCSVLLCGIRLTLHVSRKCPADVERVNKSVLPVKQTPWPCDGVPAATTPARADWPRCLDDLRRCWEFLQSHLVSPAPGGLLRLRGRVSRDQENRSTPERKTTRIPVDGKQASSVAS
ncbi:unnamed protein product [Pleuronectes platessa]|uniref:Secreted protein n=1 Tax=Pleuronectes platessa TaxID=8262 RepID=A0A9N7V418_PLEPL|nr:unnamed protein product [Pleuronectes platessa]